MHLRQVFNLTICDLGYSLIIQGSSVVIIGSLHFIVSGLRIPFDEGPPLRGEEEAAGQQDPADAKQKKLRQGEEVVVFYMTKNAALLMFNKIINKIFKYE